MFLSDKAGAINNQARNSWCVKFASALRQMANRKKKKAWKKEYILAIFEYSMPAPT